MLRELQQFDHPYFYTASDLKLEHPLDQHTCVQLLAWQISVSIKVMVMERQCHGQRMHQRPGLPVVTRKYDGSEMSGFPHLQ